MDQYFDSWLDFRKKLSPPDLPKSDADPSGFICSSVSCLVVYIWGQESIRGFSFTIKIFVGFQTSLYAVIKIQTFISDSDDPLSISVCMKHSLYIFKETQKPLIGVGIEHYFKNSQTEIDLTGVFSFNNISVIY